MRSVGLGILAMLAIIVIGTHAVGGAVPNLWVQSSARKCVPGGPTRYCVATVAARVTTVWHDLGRENEPSATELTVTAPGRGELHATLSPADGARLAPAEGDEVRLTVLDTTVLTVTAVNGETATAAHEWEVAEAVLVFLGVSAGAVLLVSAAGLLWRRRRGGAHWVAPAATSVVVGVVLGVGAGGIATRELAMPAMFGVTTVASVLVACAWVGYLRPALVRD